MRAILGGTGCWGILPSNYRSHVGKYSGLHIKGGGGPGSRLWWPKGVLGTVMGDTFPNHNNNSYLGTLDPLDGSGLWVRAYRAGASRSKQSQ